MLQMSIYTQSIDSKTKKQRFLVFFENVKKWFRHDPPGTLSLFIYEKHVFPWKARFSIYIRHRANARRCAWVQTPAFWLDAF